MLSGRLIAGIGFRRGTSAEEIVRLIRRALAEGALSPDDLGAVATVADRAGESPVREASAAFGLTPTPVSTEALISVDFRVPTRSVRIEATRGVGSVAEAAALAVAGEGGTLVLARIASLGATCALALAAQSATQAP